VAKAIRNRDIQVGSVLSHEIRRRAEDSRIRTSLLGQINQILTIYLRSDDAGAKQQQNLFSVNLSVVSISPTGKTQGFFWHLENVPRFRVAPACTGNITTAPKIG
jgi:hypothetical protein